MCTIRASASRRKSNRISPHVRARRLTSDMSTEACERYSRTCVVALVRCGVSLLCVWGACGRTCVCERGRGVAESSQPLLLSQAGRLASPSDEQRVHSERSECVGETETKTGNAHGTREERGEGRRRGRKEERKGHDGQALFTSRPVISSSLPLLLPLLHLSAWFVSGSSHDLFGQARASLVVTFSRRHAERR